MISDTPVNVMDMSFDEVLKYADTVPDIPSARVRLNYTKMLYDVLGYELTPDIVLASVSEPQAELVISTAGSGKTTWSQIKGISQKLFRKCKSDKSSKISGGRILSIVYNVHNVQDMTTRHAQMVGKLMAANIKGLDIDDKINACTMHSFCDFFRRQYIARLGMLNFSLATDDVVIGFMQRALTMEAKVQKNPDLELVSPEKVHSLYVLTKETLSSPDECTEYDVYTDVGLEPEQLTVIFTRYEQVKKRSFKYEFIDILYNIYDLLRKDPEILKSVQGYFEYVIADEVQDFTPLMWELLKLFVSDGTPLTCIGDEDQNLYNFRGASIDGILNFRKMFPTGKIYTISENRRCSKVILDEARRVIEKNVLRFDKVIHGSKVGGTITTQPYRTLDGQVTKLVNEIKKLSVDEQCSTVVCYKDTKYSALVSDMLAEEGIPMYCIKGHLPYSHELYGHVISILTALESPMDRENYKNLWKVLPCKKAEFFESIHYDPVMKKFTTRDDKINFADFNYGRLLKYHGFADAIATLKNISDDIDTVPVADYFPVVMRLLKLYFWNYKKSVNDSAELDEIFEKRVIKKFMNGKTFAQLYSEILQARGLCTSNSKTKTGVAISTFHSLKGLEFNNVYAICLDNEIFPNFPLIESKCYSERTKQMLREAETRLWYVVITRAKNNLSIYYKEDNPSIYVTDYLESKNNIGGQDSQMISNAEDEFAEGEFAEDEFAEDGSIHYEEVEEYKSKDVRVAEAFTDNVVTSQEKESAFDLDSLVTSGELHVENGSNSGYLKQLLDSL